MSITVGYELISGNYISGSLGDLVDSIIEAFVNEKIDESKSREFYNIECDLEIEELEEYGVFKFSVDVSMEFKESLLEDDEATREILREHLLEVARGFVSSQLLERVMYDRTVYESMRLKLNNDSRIEADYTLGYILATRENYWR